MVQIPVMVSLLAMSIGADPGTLPVPRTEGGMPLMEALAARTSTRAFSGEALDPQTLSELLWAAWGINRGASGKRTAPSAMNWQDMSVYVVRSTDTSIYDAAGNRLRVVVADADLRGDTGKQDFVATAPLNLVYVSDYAKMTKASLENKAMYAGAHAGFIAQNVYLFCAARGLGTVVRASIDREVLAKKLGLGADQHIILAQTVGAPAK